MNIGYIRVSDRDQNLGRQLEKMHELNIEERFIYVDKKSGKNFNREGYIAMRRTIRQGDLLYIDSLDRLGRNYDEVITEWKTITRTIGADIIALDNQELFDSRKFKNMGDIGKLMEDQFLSLLAYVADQRRQEIRRQQREGIDLCLKEGRPYGRKKLPIPSEQKIIIKKWQDKEITAVEAMKILGYSKTTFYRRVKEIVDN
ncbi:MAG: recombinase [Firmicutes bacterium]|nr:recombinase [Bacillota bacterium]